MFPQALYLRHLRHVGIKLPYLARRSTLSRVQSDSSEVIDVGSHRGDLVESTSVFDSTKSEMPHNSQKSEKLGCNEVINGPLNVHSF